MNPRNCFFRLYQTAAVGIALLTQNALAWGPHSEITRAALDAIGREDALYGRLGADTEILTQYVWMADWRQRLLVRADEVFYVDDYLLFPKAKTHSQHICPEVRQTYAPFFRRALQALRTESPRNAARWIGSLLHFTTDTGSPPHAAGILGPVHSKMENWLNAKQIRLSGYRPRLLGEDDASAESGFLSRMDGLIEFSKERAVRCRADIDADRREPVEPVVLESALETARVTADLLHTLGVLAAKPATGSTLSGHVVPPKTRHPSLDRLTAKIVLLGTDYSTLAAQDGSFAFRHLPAGDYTLVALSPGATSEPKPLSLKGEPLVLPALSVAAKTDGNLVRNGEFSLHWNGADVPDHWTMKTPPGKIAGRTALRDWDGEWLPLENGVSYRLEALWKTVEPGTDAPQIFVRFKRADDGAGVPSESEPLAAPTTRLSVKATPETAWAQICIRSALAPARVLESVRFHRED
jgi:hypothetical protein